MPIINNTIWVAEDHVRSKTYYFTSCPSKRDLITESGGDDVELSDCDIFSVDIVDN